MNTRKGFSATAKYLPIAPSKVRRVADKIRKKPYSEAIAILESLPHKGAALLKQTIESAAANALYANKKLDEDTFYVRELQVDEGPRMKRMWPRSRGRADRLLKRLCHIRVVLDEIGQGETSGTES
jgi:large subunit ribosomal protein L22